MTDAQHRRLLPAVSPIVPVCLFVALLAAAGFIVTRDAVTAARRSSAQQRASSDVEQTHALLSRAALFINGLGSALAGEPAANQAAFEDVVGSQTGTFLLSDAMWVDTVNAGARRRWEAQAGVPITRPPGLRPAAPARTYLPVTFGTGLPFPTGMDVSTLGALGPVLAASALGPPTATDESVVASQAGFFLVESGQFGHGPGSGGSLVLFVPASWLGLSSTLNFDRTAVSLEGRHLTGAVDTTPVASGKFMTLGRTWRIDASADPVTRLQTLLPWLALALPLVLAALVYLIVRGVVRRRRAEHEVGEILEVSLDPLCIIGVDGYLKRVNPAFEHVLGYDAAQLVEHPLLEFVLADDRQAMTESLRLMPERHGEARFESRCVRADGAVRWLQWNTRPLLERDLVYAAAHDITDIRMLAQEQAALRSVATLVAEGAPDTEVFTSVAVEVGQLLAADATRLLRYQSDGGVAVVASHGASDAEMGIRASADASEDSTWWRVAEHAAAAHDESAPDGTHPPGADRLTADVGAAVTSPIVVSGRRWGMIVAAWKRSEIVRGETEVRMGQFTELVATAVANAESRSLLAASRRRIVATADETRRRLERDLHDGVQQRLVTSVVTLKNAQQALDDGSENAGDLVRQALENTESANDELRELARGIMPAILTRGGLGPALRTVARRSPIPVELDLRTETRLPQRTEVTAYFVVSEALTNAAKHSCASTVTVTVDAIDGEVRLSIGDNGVGGADFEHGSGLLGLRDRIDAVGGRLTMQSAPGKGTRLEVELPLATRES